MTNVRRRSAKKETPEEDVLQGLWRMADYMRTPNLGGLMGYEEGTPGIMIVPRVVAHMMAEQGWTKSKLRQFLCDNSKIPVEQLRRGGAISWFEIDSNPITRESIKQDPWPVTLEAREHRVRRGGRIAPDACVLAAGDRSARARARHPHAGDVRPPARRCRPRSRLRLGGMPDLTFLDGRTAEVGASESIDAVNERFYAAGLTDGLPIIPPTRERVDAMLGKRDPRFAIATLAPLMMPATNEGVAYCAVMAGCRPEHMPVLIAAVQAIAEPQFNLLGVQTTTGSAAVSMIVNGPIVKRLGVNFDVNALGPGVRANAAMGRALALILRNIAGAIPNELDMATMGQPGKYTFCYAENEAASAWEPLHASRGFQRDESCVTVFAAAGTMEVRDECSNSAESLLTTFGRSMIAAGSAGRPGTAEQPGARVARARSRPHRRQGRFAQGSAGDPLRSRVPSRRRAFSRDAGTSPEEFRRHRQTAHHALARRHPHRRRRRRGQQVDLHTELGRRDARGYQGDTRKVINYRRHP